jgi:hypothetical protein
VPLWVLDLDQVPSLHCAVAPAGAGPADFVVPVDVVAGAVSFVAGVLVVALGFWADAGAGALAGGGVAAGAEADGVEELEAAFCTPPWPLQAPRPVAVEVVPSLHCVGAAAAAPCARAGRVQAIVSAEAAMSEIMDFDFMIYSWEGR